MTIYDIIKNLEKMLLRLLLGVRLLIYSKKRTTGAVTNKGRLLLKVRALIQTLRYGKNMWRNEKTYYIGPM